MVTMVTKRSYKFKFNLTSFPESLQRLICGESGNEVGKNVKKRAKIRRKFVDEKRQLESLSGLQ